MLALAVSLALAAGAAGTPPSFRPEEAPAARAPAADRTPGSLEGALRGSLPAEARR